LVGPSGAGKTTLFNLIPRFYDPTAGEILSTVKPLKSVTLHSLRTHIGFVPQETGAFFRLPCRQYPLRRPRRFGNENQSGASRGYAHNSSVSCPWL